MKLKILLILSIGLNVLLGVKSLSPAKPIETDAQEASPASEPEAKPSQASAPAENTPSPQVVLRKFNWESVESPDYREYIDNLKSIGCPEETIRDIILADVNKLYDKKKLEVKGKPKPYEYWKAGMPFLSNTDPEKVKALAALDTEKNNLLRALGIEPDFDIKASAAAMINPLEEMLAFLPDEKKSKVMNIFQEMQAKMAEMMKDGAPDGEAIFKIQKEAEESMKAMMTDEEFLAYDLRFSQTANMMRMQLGGFDPNEEEFMDVFKLRKAFDEQFNPMTRNNETTEERTLRQNAEKELETALQTALGDDRYKDYKRASDWQFQNTLRALKKADLDQSVAIQAYDIQKAAEKEAQAVRADSSLKGEARQAALEAIRLTTENALQQAMGEKGWEQYNRPQTTGWLNGIHRERPASTSDLSAPKEIIVP